MRTSLSCWLFGLLCFTPLTASYAMPVITINVDHFEPGLALSWLIEGNTTVFFLARDVDGAQLVPLLSPKMPQYKIHYANGKLYVQGPTGEACLRALAAIDLPQEHDPMADLSVLGHTVVASRAVSGGGSIRAGKTMNLEQAVAPTTANEPNSPASDANLPLPTKLSEERFEAEVVGVERLAFPEVRLTLLIRKAPTSEKWRALAPKDSRILVKPAFAGILIPLDVSQPVNQQLLLANYLLPKDRITARIKEPANGDKDYPLVELQRLESSCPMPAKQRLATAP